MRPLSVPLFLLVATSLAAQPPADRPPGGLPPFPGPTVTKASLERAIALYLDPAVQTELKLTADQKSALGKLADAALAKHKDALDKVEADRKDAAANREKANAKQAADTDAALAKHLSADQMARVRQLRFQMLGLSAFRTPEVAAAVKLTAEQERGLEEAGAEINRRFDRAPAPGEAAPARPLAANRGEAARKAFDQFVAGLTADQQAAWKKLAGEPSAAVSSLTFFGAARTAPPAALIQRVLFGQLGSNEALQAELKLTPEQVKRVPEVMSAMQPRFGDRPDAVLVRTVTSEVTAAAAKVLTPEQTTRLAQLRRQLAGLAVFDEIEMLKSLKLTPEQARAVEAAATRTRRPAGVPPGFTPPAGDGTDADRRRRQMEEAAAKAMAQDAAAVADLVAKLDDSQRRAWDGLVGPAFDTAKLGPAVLVARQTVTFFTAPDERGAFRGRTASPADAWAFEARRLVAAGQSTEAVKAYDEALRLKPDATGHMTSLAWLLATSPDNTVRNGKRAVDLAEKACSQVKAPSASFLGTLAAAYAEVGRFADAAATQEKALAAAKASGRTGPGALIANRPQGDEARLKLYQDGKPYREPRD